MNEAMQKAVDNLNAAFDLKARLPIMDIDVLTLADLADQHGRADIAACLRDALQLEADSAAQPACHCSICLDC